MKACITCAYLGNCETATEKMVRDDQGCGSWEEAILELVEARRSARAMAGAHAIQEMLNTPSEKLI